MKYIRPSPEQLVRNSRTMRHIFWSAVLGLSVLALICAVPVAPAAAQSGGTPTATYTPIPTRTPLASTQAVVIIHTSDDTPLLIQRSVSYGDVYVVTAIAAVFCLGALYWAYQWVSSHIQVKEQQ